jgi:hypothetical protein
VLVELLVSHLVQFKLVEMEPTPYLQQLLAPPEAVVVTTKQMVELVDPPAVVVMLLLALVLAEPEQHHLFKAIMVVMDFLLALTAAEVAVVPVLQVPTQSAEVQVMVVMVQQPVLAEAA